MADSSATEVDIAGRAAPDPGGKPPAPATRRAGPVARFFDGDLWYSFKRSPLTIVAAVVFLIIVIGAVFAGLLAPHNPLTPMTMDARTPPFGTSYMGNYFILGSDNQGRGVLSAILYGLQISLSVGLCSVLFAMVLGVGLGLLAGYMGGWVDALIMRIADIQLSFPAILIALLVDGVTRELLGQSQRQADLAFWVLTFSIGFSLWVQYARTVRGSTLVERNKEYVQAARVIGIHPLLIMLRHVLPNVTGPVLVIATIGLAIAIITEATLSFLGVGFPPTRPSLGTLIQQGQQVLGSEWWIATFSGLALVLLALSVNLLGDWLRDALNPKLR
ncbi:MAG: ABC transporter permease [Rhodospirillaceae bacterium]|nr:ABC transporter permease [Rhodospirillaceae bacterium]